MEFQEIGSEAALKAVYPLICQLRSGLDYAEYLENYQRAKQADNYTLLGIYEQDQCIAVMGYRFLHDFVHGKNLYIDDLVTHPDHRSRGLGAKLLKKAKEIAQQEQCKRLRLLTGIDNKRARQFYEREGWKAISISYKV